MPARRASKMIDEVDRSLAALDLDDAHAAAAALARVYAGQLDSAEAAERAADRLITRALRADVEPEIEEALSALRSKLAARATIATIGPRMETLLGRLLATPKDAGVGSKPAPNAGGPRPATAGALALLRGGKSG